MYENVRKNRDIQGFGDTANEKTENDDTPKRFARVKS